MRSMSPSSFSRGMSMAITKTIAAAAMFAIMTCIGCAPGPRRLSRSRSHLSPQCRQHLNHRTTEVPILLVAVQGGGPTLLHLCSHPDRLDGDAVASTSEAGINLGTMSDTVTGNRFHSHRGPRLFYLGIVSYFRHEKAQPSTPGIVMESFMVRFGRSTRSITLRSEMTASLL